VKRKLEFGVWFTPPFENPLPPGGEMTKTVIAPAGKRWLLRNLSIDMAAGHALQITVQHPSFESFVVTVREGRGALVRFREEDPVLVTDTTGLSLTFKNIGSVYDEDVVVGVLVDEGVP
jgi:hypothetical protein